LDGGEASRIYFHPLIKVGPSPYPPFGYLKMLPDFFCPPQNLSGFGPFEGDNFWVGWGVPKSYPGGNGDIWTIIPPVIPLPSISATETEMGRYWVSETETETGLLKPRGRERERER